MKFGKILCSMCIFGLDCVLNTVGQDYISAEGKVCEQKTKDHPLKFGRFHNHFLIILLPMLCARYM